MPYDPTKKIELPYLQSPAPAMKTGAAAAPAKPVAPFVTAGPKPAAPAAPAPKAAAPLPARPPAPASPAALGASAVRTAEGSMASRVGAWLGAKRDQFQANRQGMIDVQGQNRAAALGTPALAAAAPAAAPAPRAAVAPPVAAAPVQPRPVAATPAARETRTPAPIAAPAAAAARVPGMTTLTGGANVDGDVAITQKARPSVASKRGDFGENVYDNASIARLGGAAPAPAAAPAPLAMPAIPQVQAQTASIAGNGGAGVIGIPGEDERRAQIRETIFRSNLGTARSGSERRAMAQAFAQGEADRAAMALDAQRGTREQSMATQRNATELAQTNATTGLDASKTNATIAQAQAALAQQGGQFDRQLASTEKLATLTRPQLVAGADGGTYLVDGSKAEAVKDADGNPLRQATKSEGAVTPAVQFDALQKDKEALLAFGVPQDPDAAARLNAQLNEISARQAALANGGNGAAPSARPSSFDDFVQKARAAGSTGTDAQLRAYYDKTYGGK